MKLRSKFLPIITILGIGLMPTLAICEDIDIFVGNTGSSATNPNILIVLDNTPNWSRQSQKWPGDTQGQAEARAIKAVLNNLVTKGLNTKVNIGFMEFVTEGNANDTGGYIRRHVKPMTTSPDNVTPFQAALDKILADGGVNDVHEKTNGSRPYGDLMRDVYNYLAGANSFSPGGVYIPSADPSGYTDTDGDPATANVTTFKSPLSADTVCGSTNIVFIGNPRASGPMGDSTDNTNALKALNGGTLTPLSLPKFTQAPVLSTPARVAATSGCYSVVPEATGRAAINDAYGWAWSEVDQTCRLFAPTVGTLSGTKTDPANGLTCPYYVDAKGAASTTVNSALAGFADASTVNGCKNYTQGCTVGTPGLQSTTKYDPAAVPPAIVPTGILTPVYLPSQPSETDAATAALVSPAVACSVSAISGTCKYKSVRDGAAIADVTAAKETAACFSPTSEFTRSGKTAYAMPLVNSAQSLVYDNVTTSAVSAATILSNANLSTFSPAGLLDCPANNVCTYTWAAEKSGGCPKSNSGVTNGQQSATLLVTRTAIQKYRYRIYAQWEELSSTDTACPAGTAKFDINGSNKTQTNVATTESFTDTGTRNADEWARFMYEKGIPISGGTNQSVSTFTIDVYNEQPNDVQTSLLLNMANTSGGRYFPAKSEKEITDALTSILSTIQAVNTTFASASLPVNATNRTQNENQVFIGMFRPDRDGYPRWFGNLKQYQVGAVLGGLDLVDANKRVATNPLTGFIDNCAVSLWNKDTYSESGGGYWQNVFAKNPTKRVSFDANNFCNSPDVTVSSNYSDKPDGPFVEKGGVSNVLRRGNDPASADSWLLNRVLYTCSPSGSACSREGFSTNRYVMGYDDDSEQGGAIFRNDTPATTETPVVINTVRPSAHGDVVHSRPLPVNYGKKVVNGVTYGVVVYYGANDGMLRAVDSTNGKELWAFTPPEFSDRYARMRANAPLVDFTVAKTEADRDPKDYFWDGSIGIVQDATSSNVMLFPTQRRGGRMVYGLNVTDPANPSVLWRRGCASTSLTDDTSCVEAATDTEAEKTAFKKMGLTWSTPMAAYIKGYADGSGVAKPVVIFGGGYDLCEDLDKADTNGAFTCSSSSKGTVVYILDATTGVLLRSFNTRRSVVADISLVDVTGDALVDYAYVTDTGGNIYRIEFIDGPTRRTPMTSANWVMNRVAYTNGGGRKMLFNPGLLAYQGKYIYVAITTGDRERPLLSNYPSATPVTNRAYVYLDQLTDYPVNSTVAEKTALITECNLDSDTCTADYTSSSVCKMVDGKEVCSCTRDPILPPWDAAKPKGWRMDLTSHGVGEQGVTSSLIVGGQVIFSTNQPAASGAGTCANTLGIAYGYRVGLLNAEARISANDNVCDNVRSVTMAGGGLPPSPVFGIVPIDGVATAIVIGAPPSTVGSGISIKPERATPAIQPVRSRKYKFSTIDR